MAGQQAVGTGIPVPYSPNLNRLSDCASFYGGRLKILFYHTKDAFRQAMLGFFSRLDEIRRELASLLTLKFHFSHRRPLCDEFNRQRIVKIGGTPPLFSKFLRLHSLVACMVEGDLAKFSALELGCLHTLAPYCRVPLLIGPRLP
jgi:hypothetical protein